MKLLITILTIALAVYIQQQDSNSIDQYMRNVLRSSTTVLNKLSKIAIGSTSTRMSNSTTSSNWVGYPIIPPEDPSLNATNPKPRSIQQIFLAREQSEGAGATVRRSIGTPKLKNLTPFLMLDHFSVAVGAGFPDHPHRGQETITYLLSGGVDHEDFTGEKGTLYAGDLQFMTAGRGVVHAEMPHDNGDGSANVGMQLWVDLPRDLKNCEPRYRDLRGPEIPVASVDEGRVSVKVISGRSHGVDSLQELAYTPVWLLDITIKPGGRIEQSLPRGWNAFAYTLNGTTIFSNGEKESRVVEKYHNTVFAQQGGDAVVASVREEDGEHARFILVAGMPLDQPIVQYGPFVLTDPTQVRQAVMDYSTYSNGFERAEGWRSEIGRSLM